MRISHWITKASNRHSNYVILNAWTRQQRLSERASTLRYTHVHSLSCFVLAVMCVCLVKLRPFNISTSKPQTRHEWNELCLKGSWRSWRPRRTSYRIATLSTPYRIRSSAVRRRQLIELATQYVWGLPYRATFAAVLPTALQYIAWLAEWLIDWLSN
jgi:hypothetical protein